MDGTCSTHGGQKKFWSENLRRTAHLGKLDVVVEGDLPDVEKRGFEISPKYVRRLRYSKNCTAT
jgi:hypothetical protein